MQASQATTRKGSRDRRSETVRDYSELKTFRRALIVRTDVFQIAIWPAEI